MILKRLFRLALASSLTRAWAQKSTKWLAVAGGVLLFRLIDKRAAKSGQKTTKSKSA